MRTEHTLDYDVKSHRLVSVSDEAEAEAAWDAAAIATGAQPDWEDPGLLSQLLQQDYADFDSETMAALIRRDIKFVQDADAAELLKQPLFLERAQVSISNRSYEDFSTNLQGGDWQFILDWYQDVRDGELWSDDLGEIALARLSEKDWQSSAAALDQRFQEIKAIHQLNGRIHALEQSAGWGAATIGHNSKHIGHNNPPEDMQIEPQVIRETTIVWAAVDELKAEAEKEAPDKSTVLRIIETLGQALKAILVWCARKLDLSVDTLIKWGIPIGAAAILANPKHVADVIEAAKVWVPFLP